MIFVVEWWRNVVGVGREGEGGVYLKEKAIVIVITAIIVAEEAGERTLKGIKETQEGVVRATVGLVVIIQV